mgnify:CR=1 FL=1
MSAAGPERPGGDAAKSGRHSGLPEPPEPGAKALPDGYTMGLCSLGFSYAPALYSRLPFDPARDFAPISLVATQPFVYVVIPALGVNSMKELIALAKARPGDVLYGTAGVGAYQHLSTSIFANMAGLKIVHVPFKGGAPAVELR